MLLKIEKDFATKELIKYKKNSLISLKQYLKLVQKYKNSTTTSIKMHQLKLYVALSLQQKLCEPTHKIFTTNQRK